MIVTRDQRIAAICAGRSVPGLPPDVQDDLHMAIDILQNATTINDVVLAGKLEKVPNNAGLELYTLEYSRGRKLKFVWKEGNARDVSIE